MMSNAGITPQAAEDMHAELQALFDSGRTRSLKWRRDQIAGLKRLADERQADIEQSLKDDMCRCPAETVGEVLTIWEDADMALRNLGAWTRETRVSTSLVFPFASFSYQFQPLGVALIMSPWNFPWMLSLSPLVSALAAGNVAVVKPSEFSPASSALIAKLLPMYCDPEAVRVVQGDAEAARTLLRLKWGKIFFTGSATVGRLVASAAAQHLTPLTLELGGKNPAYIDATADLQAAANRILFSRMLNAGQVCLAIDYLLVPESLVDEMEAVLRRTLERFYGPRPEQSPVFARIISERHCQRLAALLADEGTRDSVVAGGQVEVQQRYVAPTLLRDVPWDAPIMREEVFGPILALQSVSGLDEALRRVKQLGAPLAAYVYSTDASVFERFQQETQSGSLVSGESVIFVLNHRVPFGGVGASGYGKCHGRFGFEAFSHSRALIRNTLAMDPTFRYPPYSVRAVEILYALSKWRFFTLLYVLFFGK